MSPWQEGLDLLVSAIEQAGYTGKVKIGMDVAASEFCEFLSLARTRVRNEDGRAVHTHCESAAHEGLDDKKVYDLDFKTENNDGSMCKSGEQLLDVYKDFVENYPMVSIEDPFDQVRTRSSAARLAVPQR